MNIRHVVSFLCLVLSCAPALRAQFGTPEEMAAQARIESVIEKVREKTGKGPVTKESLAPELQELDNYVIEFEAHPEQVAQFIYTKAMIYADALADFKEARGLFLSIKRDHSKTQWAGEADKMILFLEKAERRNAVNAELSPLLEEIMVKAQAGAKTAEALAAEIRKLDALIAKHAKNPEAAAHVTYYKANVYGSLLQEIPKAREMLLALKSKYPDTLATEAAQKILDHLPAPETK